MSAPLLAARIRSLHVYPVKSCRGIDLQEARLAARGLTWDRHWMVVDAAGHFLTQRTHPQMARVETALEAAAMVLTAVDHPPLRLPYADVADAPGETTVRVWNDTVLAADCGGDAAAWISAVLATPAQLVRATDATRRQPAPRWRGDIEAPVSFADGFPLLVCNAASLDDLLERLPQPASLPMDRFRPNIVLEGLTQWAEDAVDELELPDARLRLAKPCTRCVIPSRDQRSGEPGTDPLPALRRFRFDREQKGVTFGWNAVITAGVGATLRVGQSVRLLPRAPQTTAPT